MANTVAYRVEGDLGLRWEFLRGHAVELLAPAGGEGMLVVNPDAEYVFYAVEPGRAVVVLKQRLAHVLAESNPEHLRVRALTVGAAALEAASFSDSARILGYATGEDLAGLTAREQGQGAAVPVMADASVALDEGTGVVRVTA